MEQLDLVEIHQDLNKPIILFVTIMPRGMERQTHTWAAKAHMVGA